MRCGTLQSDWEASSDEEKPAPAPASVAPAKKKGSLKQKLAEKEAARQARIASGDGDVEYDEDAVLDPRARARLEKERELESDLHHAKELFGSVTIKGACSYAHSFSPLFQTKRLPSYACPGRVISFLYCRLVGRGPRSDLKIDAQNQGRLYCALGRHRRARHQTTSGQAAVRLVCRAPRARTRRAAA